MPGHDGIDLTGSQHLWCFIRRDVYQFHIGFGQSVIFQGVDQQQMADEADFDTDFFPLQFLDRADTRTGNNHVITVTVIIHQEHHALGTGRTGHQRIAIGHTDGVQLAGRKRVHGGDIVKPFELDIDTGFLEPAFFNPDFPCHPAGPVTVADTQWFGRLGH